MAEVVLPEAKENRRLMKDGLDEPALDRLVEAMTLSWPAFDGPPVVHADRLTVRIV